MAAGGNGVALVDQVNGLGVGAVELADHVQDLAVTHDGGLGVAQHHIAQSGGVVGLHVVDKNVVQLAAGQGVVQIFKELGLDRTVHSVHQNSLFIQEKIGVKRHPTRHGMGGLEQGVLAVVAAHPDEVLGDMTDTMHI